MYIFLKTAYQRFLLWKQELKEKLPQVKDTITVHLQTNIFTYIVWIFVVAVVAGIVWYIKTLCSKETINAWEIRLYIFVAFLFQLVLLFGVLRLYNAIVANTQYLLRLQTALKSTANVFSKTAQSMVSVGKSIKQAIGTIKNKQ